MITSQGGTTQAPAGLRGRTHTTDGMRAPAAAAPAPAPAPNAPPPAGQAASPADHVYEGHVPQACPANAGAASSPKNIARMDLSLEMPPCARYAE